MLTEVDEPTTYNESLNSLESEKWLETMRSEMDPMYTNQVWTLVEPTKGIKPIGWKWIFKRKTNMEGNVITYVAKGFRQRQGIDYDETFSLLAMFKSKGTLSAIATHYDYEIWKMDVEMTFRKGNLSKDV